MENRKLLNNASSKSMSCVAFLDILHVALVYRRTSDECYPGQFRKERVYDVCKDVMSANFNREVNPTVYNQYIGLDLLCIIHRRFLELIGPEQSQSCTLV